MTVVTAEKPLISIIIPTFNSGKTIAFSLESIKKQTFRDFEVLVMDAASTDNTLEVAKSFQKDIPLNIYSAPDKGIYDAMNKGIAKAKGEWLYFLGSDDELYEASTLEKVASWLHDKFEVVYGNVFSDRFGGVYAGAFSQKKIYNQNICHQSVFFRRSVFGKTGLFDLRFERWADYDHNFKWFLPPGVIKHTFVDLIIAKYADGGFSSQSEDLVFLKVKNWKYYFHLRKVTSKRKKFTVLISQLWIALISGRIKDFMMIMRQSFKFMLNL
jgi:glycosyltransferase involved in cell wall biosynthesis